MASSPESLSSDDNAMDSSSESLSSDDNTMDSSSESLGSDDNATASSSESLSSGDGEASESLSSGDGDDEKRLHIQEESSAPKKSPAQKLAESWRTIEQIKNLNPKEYNEETTFLCRVSLVDIDCSSGWCYLGCDTCQKSMFGAPRKYKCSRCGPIKRPIQWYKLKTKVKDATGTMNLMIFCEVAEELVGVSAEELVDKIKDDDEWYTLPDAIEDLLGSTHTFQVFDKYRNGSFSVNSIMNHVSIPVPAASTKQCKEKHHREGDAVPTPTTNCKEDPIPEGSNNTAVPTPTNTQRKEDPLPVASDPVPKPTTTQCKKKSVAEESTTAAEAVSNSTELQKPNKRMRRDN